MEHWQKITLALVAVLGLAGFGFFLLRPVSFFSGPPAPPGAVESRDGFFEQQQAIAGFRRYQNLLFKFRLQIPEELSLREVSEGNTSTLAFEDAESGRGFQIFVVPYEGSEVSQERFNMDVPSGVIEEPTDILVDGVSAKAFFSENISLGKTREVWFIYPEPSRGVQSFLFEVTTYRELDPWLSQILSTWRFL